MEIQLEIDENEKENENETQFEIDENESENEGENEIQFGIDKNKNFELFKNNYSIENKQQKKVKYIRDPNAPKDPVQPFVYFTRKVTKEFLEKYPNTTIIERAKLIKESWDKLGVKQLEYFEKSIQDHKRYELEKADYQKNGGKWFIPYSYFLLSKASRNDQYRHYAPKKPRNAFLVYHQKHRTKLTRQCPSEKFQVISTVCAKNWKQLTRNQVKHFLRMSNLDKQRYREEYKQYLELKKNNQQKHNGKNKSLSKKDNISPIQKNLTKLKNNSQKNVFIPNKRPLITKYKIYYGSKPKDLPKNPKTPFFIFYTEFRKAYVKKHGKTQITEVSGKSSEKWKNLSFEEKKRYYALADDERIIYDREMEEVMKDKDESYVKQFLNPLYIVNSKPSQTNKPKEPLPTNEPRKNKTKQTDYINELGEPIKPHHQFIQFMEWYRGVLRKENHDLLPHEFSKLAGKKWRLLPIKEKLKFEQFAEKDRKRYRIQKKDYEKYLKDIKQLKIINEVEDFENEIANINEKEKEKERERERERDIVVKEKEKEKENN
ncbi:high mobility group protein dsp1 [Anaeramoeba flamelloides]|uniref:High mobility group protein dsp1 n=1 Tax=Anaeramoeba flamelloides TaxID=1746091 RepID=A0ABQ8XMF9_9EUKA|nr:high mobility group protein dsp1 [Anaeramoeba flamelloides]